VWKVVGVVGVIAASWAAGFAIKHFSNKEASSSAASVTAVKPAEPNVVVVSKEEILNRLDQSAGVSNIAYSHVEAGLISYEFPLVANRRDAVHVQWFDRGAEHDSFLEALRERGVLIKPGSVRRDEKKWEEAEAQAERDKKLLHEEKRLELWNSMYQGVGTVMFLALSISFLARLLVRVRLRGLPGDISGEEVEVGPEEGFSQVGGIDQVLQELTSLRDEIRQVTEGDSELELPKGTLFFGPPGTGKTMTARALAAETECPFISYKGSDLSTELFVGTGVRKIRNVFAQGRKLRDKHTEELRKKTNNPNARGVCIIFIDEFESIASRRMPDESRGGIEDTRVVNMLLTELDNIHKNDASDLSNRDILVIAATNNCEKLDPAVVRNGRFNRKIEIPAPRSKAARLDILNKATTNILERKGWTLEDRDTSLEKLARISVGNSGADLVGVLEKAQAIVRRKGLGKVISFDDLMEGFQQQNFGFKESSVVSSDERRKVAFHEVVGHGVMAWACKIATFLISMEPRGRSLGRVIPDPEALSEVAPTKQQLLQRILVSVAGQVAERLRYGHLGATVGNTADLDSIRELLKLLISTGLLGDDVATSLIESSRSDEPELSDSQKQLMNRAYKRAIDTVESILGALSPEEWDKIVDECLALDKELVGDEAQAFLERHLGSNQALREKVQEALDAYLNDPLGPQSGLNPVE
jgi:ATP-dependent Zn protease